MKPNILIAHREDKGDPREYLAERGISLPEEGVIEETTIAGMIHTLEENDIDVMINLSSVNKSFELTKSFLQRIEPYQAAVPEIDNHPKVLIVNTGHYRAREEAEEMFKRHFPSEITRPIYAVNMTEAMETLRTEEVDIIVANISNKIQRGEARYVVEKLNEARGVDHISARGITLDRATRMASVEDRIVQLSKIEASLLELMLSRPGIPLGAEYILAIVWQSDYPEDTSLVRGAIKRLRQKIESDPHNPQYIRTIGNSYMLGEYNAENS